MTESFFIGVWRSLVARTAGGREVAGSNPVAPIWRADACLFYLLRKSRAVAKWMDMSV